MARILVIDDEPEIVAMFEIALGDIYCVHPANSGRAGLKLLKEQPFDLVITDIFMPEVDGFEIIMHVNTLRPRPHVIAMSGFSGKFKFDCLPDVATALGVQQVLYKPFSITQLLETVARTLEESGDEGQGVRDCFSNISTQGTGELHERE
jgi:YesN/AraC family two-component response regulator